MASIRKVREEIFDGRFQLRFGCKDCPEPVDGASNHRCEPQHRKLYVKIKNKQNKEVWTKIRARRNKPEEPLTECPHAACKRGEKCPKAHSKGELHVWRVLVKYKLFLDDFIQKELYCDQDGEDTVDSTPTAPKPKANIKRIRVRRHSGSTRNASVQARSSNSNNHHYWTQTFIHGKFQGGRFLFVCEDCFNLDPHIVIEMKIGDGKDQAMYCKWCNGRNALLLHEAVENYSKNIKFYEYSIIRPRKSTGYGNQMCRNLEHCENTSSCTYAHSYLELKVWEQETRGIPRMQLVKFGRERGIKTAPTLNGIFHCSKCCLSFSDNNEYSKYMGLGNHIHIPSIKRREDMWKYRKFPGKQHQKICPRVEERSCREDCNFAHSQHELDEWKERQRVVDNRKEFTLESTSPAYKEILREKIKDGFEELATESRVCALGERSKTLTKKDTSLKWKLLLTVKDPRLILDNMAFHSTERFMLRHVSQKSYTQHLALDDHLRANLEFWILFSNPKIQENSREFLGEQSGYLFLDFTDQVQGKHLLLYLTYNVQINSNDGREHISPLIETSNEDWTRNRIIIEFPKSGFGTVPFQERIEDLGSKYEMKSVQLYNEVQDITADNYVQQMHMLLYKEEKARQDTLSRLNLECEVLIKETFNSDGHRFANFLVPSSISTDEGLLFQDSCNMVLLGKGQSEHAYEAKIVAWNKNEMMNEILVTLSQQCVKGLNLQPTESRETMHIQFRLDRFMFCQRHFAIDQLGKRVSLVCPSNMDYATLEYNSISQKFTGLDEIQKVVSEHLQARKANRRGNERKIFPPLVVAGPFGTGKTHTIRNITLELLRQSGSHSTILICTHSNSAADLYLEDERFNEWKNKILRLVYHGKKPTTIAASARECCLIRQDGMGFRYPDIQDLRNYRVIITTFTTSLALGTLGAGISGNLFTHIFLDESSQAMEADVIMPLTLAGIENTKVVIAGDHKQITERMFHPEYEQMPTLLERMYEAYENVNKRYRVLLMNNYRCVDGILQLISKLFYKENILKSMGKVKCLTGAMPVYFLQLKGECRMTDKGEFVNITEAQQIRLEINHIVKNKLVEQDDIVVISYFYQQVQLIRDDLRKYGLGQVSVQTVRNIQGKEYKVVILSCVMRRVQCLETGGKHFGFLSDGRLLNTALTRAQSMVIAVGDAITLCSIGDCEKYWKLFIKHCEEAKTILPPGVNIDIIRKEIKLAKQVLRAVAREFVPNSQAKSEDEEEAAIEADGEVPLAQDVQEVNQNDLIEEDFDDSESWCSDDSVESDYILDDMLKKALGIDPNKLTVDVDNQGREILRYEDDEDDGEDDPNEIQHKPSPRRRAGKEAIYPKYSIAQLEQLLETAPKKYRRCQLRIDSWCSGHAIPLDLHHSDPNYSHDQSLNNSFVEQGINGVENESDDSDSGNVVSTINDGASSYTQEIEETSNRKPVLDRIIYIDTKRNLGRTFDNDEVVVQLLDERNVSTQNSKPRKQFGKVLGVLKKRYRKPKERHFLCRPDENNLAFMCPIDRKLPKFAIIRPKIKQNQTSSLKIPIYKPIRERGIWTDLRLVNSEKINDQKVYVVRYLKWAEYCPYPLGFVEKSFDVTDYKKYLKLEFGVPGQHKESLNRLATILKLPTTKEQPIPVFTIDPEGSQDLDDAISVEKCEEEHKNCLMIGVHITDVAAVIAEGTQIDREAEKRGTTFYRGSSDPPIHMLPDKLSTYKCSILPNKDRPALSTYFHSCKSPPHLKGDAPIPPKRTFIKSVKRFTYREAEDLIRKAGNGETEEPLSREIYDLWGIMWKWRSSRLNEAAFYKELDSYDELLHEGRAHLLIEEAMIAVNANTALFLDDKGFEFPIKIQEPPTDDIWKNWENVHKNNIPNSNYLTSCLKHLKKLKRIREGAREEETDEDDNDENSEEWEEVTSRKKKKKKKQEVVSVNSVREIEIFKNYWEDMMYCWEHCEVEIFQFIACLDDLHPSQIPAVDWYRSTRRRAEFFKRRPNDTSRNLHFSLRMTMYTYSSSPIRRYADIIVQRCVHKALEENEATPLMKEAIKKISWNFEDRAKKFQQRLLITELAENLKQQPITCLACVTKITDAYVKINLPSIGKSIPHEATRINYAHLMINTVSKQQSEGNNLQMDDFKGVILDKCGLVWKFRYYNYRERKAEAISRESEFNRLSVSVPVEKWKTLMEVIRRSQSIPASGYERIGYEEDLKDAVDELKAHHTQRRYGNDVMVGATRNSPRPIKHQREIKQEIHPGTPASVQLYSSPGSSGLPIPSVQLLAVAEDLDVCVEHLKDPLNTFARDAESVKGRTVKSVSQYQNKWEPLIRLDAANSAVTDGSSTTIDGVKIRWNVKKKKATADHVNDDVLDNGSSSTPPESCKNYFPLDWNYCYERYIDFRRDYLLCLRLKGVPSSPGMKHVEEHTRNSKGHSSFTAVIHGIITEVKYKSKEKKKKKKIDVDQKNEKIKVYFRTFEDPHKIQNWTYIKNNSNQWTIEILPLTFVHMHLLRALRGLDEARSLLHQICLGTIRPALYRKDIPEDLEFFLKKRKLNGFQFPLNDAQYKQEQTAVKNNFTVIQGPPGTGKSYMGAHLAARFAFINKMEGKGKKILYCGPSNKSVDVAAGFLKKINDLKVVRMYSTSLEEKIYPNPLKPDTLKRSPVEDTKMPDKNLRGIALHELVRQGDNNLSRDLREFDSLVKNPNKRFGRKEVDTYKAKLREAKLQELKDSDIIVCTCSLSAILTDFEDNKGNEVLEFDQCIIDECGMCSEPETILPLVVTNARQIVFIGDHQQLQPVVTCRRAEKLGLGISLFSRLSEFAGMLVTQYRMHPTIMDFPSHQFYDGKLQCAEIIGTRGEDWIHGLPRRVALFWNVKGVEKVQHFKSIEGGDESKYNIVEARAVVKLLVRLVNSKVPHSDIMVLSPYTAQCARIREIITESHSQLKDIHVGTIVTSQGSEARIVILSTVRSMVDSSITERPNVQWKLKNLGFLANPHQINVALTRARRRLFIIGNKNLLQVHELWRQLLQSYERRHAVFDNLL